MKQGTLKAMQILHRAMLLGLILFAAIAFFLVYTNRFLPHRLLTWIIYSR